MHKQANTIVFVAIALIMLNSVHAQRPSFAGSRPTGGLNQKDKYHSTTASNVDIVDRFGAAETTTVNQIPFGASQRPPIGYPVIVPQATYVPLAAPGPVFNIDNRLGEIDAPTTPLVGFSNTATNTFAGSTIPFSTTTTTATAAAAAAAAGASSTATTPQRLPHDALGDQLLIEQLNRLPLDQRPFWFLNYQAIEASRNGTGTGAATINSRGSFAG
ncbi:uncharacterized protein LOC119668542 [Teleopsis dalmanni]|uniref:uncharacterized protein LOC119668542 n=1 Tax=Teleopsis dalmanni TaxID=139649 RepID=UPI0018CE902B|nr:uncharacterized protein LOC119668542 [Teleopsis dalmanni]